MKDIIPESEVYRHQSLKMCCHSEAERFILAVKCTDCPRYATKAARCMLSPRLAQKVLVVRQTRLPGTDVLEAAHAAAVMRIVHINVGGYNG